MSIFIASNFVPTKWNTSEDKAKFANQFAKFVKGGFQRKDFPKWFYTSNIMEFISITPQFNFCHTK